MTCRVTESIEAEAGSSIDGDQHSDGADTGGTIPEAAASRAVPDSSTATIVVDLD